MSVYVSFGRNIKGSPMPLQRWCDFIDSVIAVVMVQAGPIVSVTEGTGWYDGVSEKCAIVVGEGTALKLMLRDSLASLAKTYEQDCIAVTFAEPSFIKPA